MTVAPHQPAPTPRQIAARPWIRLWLLVVAALVFAMVLVGGATRLTGSGLSITEWAPVTGTIPPLSEQAWQAELEKYRQIPQYQLVNRGMSLDEFKTIYRWEWGHRLLGRLIGFVFILPFLYFLATRRLERRLRWPLAGLFLLGGLQGLMGWYMVMSGLVDRVSVSQYRLAAHLGLAFLIYALIIWASELLRERAPETAAPRPLLRGGWIFLVLLFLQIIVGAFVAGLDAGLAYRSWPLMDGRFIPTGLLLLEPWWRNLFESVTMVQFLHRMLGYLVVLTALYHAVDAVRRLGEGPAVLRAALLAALSLLQVGLGIATLLLGVPITVALLHQAGALILLTIAVIHVRAMTVAARDDAAVVLARPAMGSAHSS